MATRQQRLVWSLVLGSTLALGMPSQGQAPPKGGGIWQNMPFIALVNGHFQGITPVAEARRQGNLGIGAMEAVDGELLFLDGKLYRFRSVDGGIRVDTPPDRAKLSLAIMTRFTPGRRVQASPGLTFPNLCSFLDPQLPTVNTPYALRIRGVFRNVVARTFIRQEPYTPICKAGQTKVTYEKVEGTMVGFRYPLYVGPVNQPSYHLHFLTADRKGGGHVLSFEVEKAEIEIARAGSFAVALPTDEAFAKMSLAVDPDCPPPAPVCQ